MFRSVLIIITVLFSASSVASTFTECSVTGKVTAISTEFQNKDTMDWYVLANIQVESVKLLNGPEQNCPVAPAQYNMVPLKVVTEPSNFDYSGSQSQTFIFTYSSPRSAVYSETRQWIAN